MWYTSTKILLVGHMEKTEKFDIWLLTGTVGYRGGTDCGRDASGEILRREASDI